MNINQEVFFWKIISSVNWNLLEIYFIWWGLGKELYKYFFLKFFSVAHRNVPYVLQKVSRIKNCY